MSSFRDTDSPVPSVPSAFIAWLPMVALQLYLGVTVFLFAFGPWPWPIYDPVALYGFLFAAHLALLLGYGSAVKKPGMAGMSMPQMRRMLLWSIVVNLLFVFPTAKARTGSWIPDVATALADPGFAYDASLDIRQTSTGPVEYARVLFGWLLFLTLPWMMYYWRSLSRLVRVAGVFWFVLWVAIAIGMGTRKALADIIIVAPWVLIAGHYGGYSRWTKAGMRWSLVVGATAMFGFLQYFATGQVTRQGGGAVTGTFGGLHIAADFEHWMVSGLSPIMKVGVTQLIIYLTQGYYALGLALEKSWIPTFGAGHSTFLFRNVARTLGLPGLAELPYPVRVTAADGWDHRILWDTIYPWIASDLSFPGTVVAMFVIGRLMAGAWKDALGGKNPLGVGILALLLVLTFYIPANNQCCQDGEGFSAFYILIIVWLLTRRAIDTETEGVSSAPIGVGAADGTGVA